MKSKLLDWTCMTCGKRGTAVYLGQHDGQTEEYRVITTHKAAQGRNSQRTRCRRPNLTWQAREMWEPKR